jgi:hypothetical protein
MQPKDSRELRSFLENIGLSVEEFKDMRKVEEASSTNGTANQGCGSGSIKSGSSIFAQSGSGSKLKQNVRRQFCSQTFLKSKFESNQLKKTVFFIF